MPESLAGTTALVTGGSRGIGRAICERLGSDGARLIVHYHREAAGAEISARRFPGSRAVQADLASREGIERMFESLRGERIHFLINNAGIWKPSPVGGTEPAQASELIGVNLMGPFWVMQSALPLMVDGGRVVNVSSVAARIGVAGGRSLYGAAKAGLEAFTRNWALELAPRRILVNGVAPGYIVTDMTADHLANPDTHRRAMERHPLGRLGTAEDVAGVVRFLCSADARFIIGQTINVSGGFVI